MIHSLASGRKLLSSWLDRYVVLLGASQDPLPGTLTKFFCSLRDSNTSLRVDSQSEVALFRLVEGYNQRLFINELNTISAMLTDQELELCLLVQLRLPK